jgi:hypothetical protein
MGLVTLSPLFRVAITTVTKGALAVPIVCIS